MNINNDIKKLMYVVMIDIEMLLKNDIYKDRFDFLEKLKKEISTLTFQNSDNKVLWQAVKEEIEGIYQEYIEKSEDSDYMVLYSDFQKLYDLVV